ncbi:MAG: UDP-N-acetylmuramoyl-L-alanyl-D-glutamate--2,6-diaminopimelate ligase [Deferribacteraceae bacterium]|jgi:UDP-N-acetylmuramoyl-L-alanyl-D-glutamate--2,6-diaminopimelate ligase|nr:UDP-N-acetylmuramoyl-L-alanyl-D-glutamate--2,6-diaminopimelate ligase [Deferribacteraceae bacterium]
MQISEILTGINVIEAEPSLVELNVPDIAYDSKFVTAGALFFAYKGTNFDSHSAVAELYAKKLISCAVSEHKTDGVPCIVVENGRRAFATACANFFGNPHKKMTTVGVTGTNGKTTVTWLLERIFNGAGFKTVRIGTTGANVAGKIYDLDNTTPSPYLFHKMLAEGVKAGATFAVSEISSHALVQDRIAGVVFDAAVFTNLTGDHLDYHKDMDAYYKAKKSLFESSRSRLQIVNTDNAYGVNIYDESGGDRFSYGREGKFLRVSDYSVNAGGTVASVVYNGEEYKLTSPLAGEFNLENILAAASAALALGIKMDAVQKGVKELDNIPGRLEKYSGDGILVFVDYAHTDDALRNVLQTLKKIIEGRLITVFGAGGDRDKSKRPRMGRTAQELSDFVIVTSDNPRTEDPERIIKDILAGMTADEKLFVEINREKAIASAIRLANKGDAVLIAGKGHENYQIIGKTSHPFSDSNFVRLYLKERCGDRV